MGGRCSAERVPAFFDVAGFTPEKATGVRTSPASGCGEPVSRTTAFSHLTPGKSRISPAPNSIYLLEISLRKENAMRLRSNELLL